MEKGEKRILKPSKKTLPELVSVCSQEIKKALWEFADTWREMAQITAWMMTVFISEVGPLLFWSLGAESDGDKNKVAMSAASALLAVSKMKKNSETDTKKKKSAKSEKESE